MSKTMSSPNDWAHFYHLHNHNQLTFSSSAAAGGSAGSSVGVAPMTTTSIVTSSSTTAAADPTPVQLMGPGRGGGGGGGGSHNSSVANSLSPEGGRVGKPARKRSRASRRTPTTLLNTDTSNFRAMVQQFTGGPAGPFVTGGVSGSSLNVPPAGFSFGLSPLSAAGQNPHHQLIGDRIIPSAAATLPGGRSGGGEGLFHYLQYQQQQFHQPSPFLFPLGNASNSDDPTNVNIGDGINSDHLLLQRGIGTEGGSGGATSGGDATAAAPPSSTSAGSNGNRNSGFLY